MEFNVSSCYMRRGERFLNEYPKIKKYDYKLDEEQDELYITIHSLEELIKFEKQFGKIIIDDDGKSLIIYDDYIE